jgi:hypothetical protein
MINIYSSYRIIPKKKNIVLLGKKKKEDEKEMKLLQASNIIDNLNHVNAENNSSTLHVII